MTLYEMDEKINHNPKIIEKIRDYDIATRL